MAHHEIWKTVRWLAFLACLVILGVLASRFVERGVQGTADGFDRGLDKVLSTITRADTRIVEGRAELQSRNEISELALVELRMSATRRFENETYILRYLPGGTKQLIVQGNYRITAGYRLEPGVSLRLDNGVPVARFPEPEILGIELLDYHILSEKDGWANDITPADRSNLLRDLRGQMRAEAAKSGVLDMTDATLRTRLRDLIGAEDIRLEHGPPVAAGE